MTVLVPIALFGWIPLILLLFTVLPARRATIVAFVGGWCFLPVYGYLIPAFPNFDKQSATCIGVLLATVIFDSGRLTRFKPRLIDLAMLSWCISPFLSNSLGGFGPYEGYLTSLRYIFLWGVPYFIGRLYFTDLRAMRELAIGLFIAGLVYTPFCLYEVKMSPQLHRMVYGFFQDDWKMTQRGGGWRPTVFMQHGLAVGLFMCTSALIGVWMWMCRSGKTIAGMPIGVGAGILFVSAVLCKSTGASVLMLIGLMVLWITTRLRTRWAFRLLYLLPVLYMAARTVGGWHATELLDISASFSEERAASLHWRLVSEDDCWDLVQPHVLFGFGRFVFGGVQLEGQRTKITADGMWLIALVANGLFGLTMLFGALILPSIAIARKIRPVHWRHPTVAPTAAVAVVVLLFAIDNLFNAMINPLFLLSAGGLVSTVGSIPDYRRAARPVAVQGAHSREMRPAVPAGRALQN